jgi:hypothetical protein
VSPFKEAPEGTLALSKPTAFKIHLKKKRKTNNERRNSEVSEDLFASNHLNENEADPCDEKSDIEIELSPDASAEGNSEIESLEEEEEEDSVVEIFEETSNSDSKKKPSTPKRLAQTRMNLFSNNKDKSRIKNTKKRKRENNEWPEPGFDGFEDPNTNLYGRVPKRSRSLIMKNGRLASIPNE